MMELFTLGADQGYSERDVREQARALTGWARDYKYDKPYLPLRPQAPRHGHEDGLRQDAANFDWRDACLLALQNPAHETYFVRKLWSYFIPTRRTRRPSARSS